MLAGYCCVILLSIFVSFTDGSANVAKKEAKLSLAYFIFILPLFFCFSFFLLDDFCSSSLAFSILVFADRNRHFCYAPSCIS